MTVKGQATVRLHAWAILSRAVEEGLAYGWTRAHKHTETPEREDVLDQQAQAIMHALSEVIDFDGES